MWNDVFIPTSIPYPEVYPVSQKFKIQKWDDGIGMPGKTCEKWPETGWIFLSSLVIPARFSAKNLVQKVLFFFRIYFAERERDKKKNQTTYTFLGIFIPSHETECRDGVGIKSHTLYCLSSVSLERTYFNRDCTGTPSQDGGKSDWDGVNFLSSLVIPSHFFC